MVSIAEYKRQLGTQKDRSINKKNFAMKAEFFGYKVEPEFRIDGKRRFKADWKVSKGNNYCLVEYEGINSQTARHTTITGYTNDCTKYNLAQINGHRILRYTMVNFCNVFEDLEKVFGKRGL